MFISDNVTFKMKGLWYFPPFETWWCGVFPFLSKRRLSFIFYLNRDKTFYTISEKVVNAGKAVNACVVAGICAFGSNAWNYLRSHKRCRCREVRVELLARRYAV